MLVDIHNSLENDYSFLINNLHNINKHKQSILREYPEKHDKQDIERNINKLNMMFGKFKKDDKFMDKINTNENKIFKGFTYMM